MAWAWGEWGPRFAGARTEKGVGNTIALAVTQPEMAGGFAHVATPLNRTDLPSQEAQNPELLAGQDFQAAKGR